MYRAFDEESVDSILSNLAEIDSEESRRTLSLLDEVCPISVILSNEIFNAGAGLTLAECLKNEFRMGRVQFRDYNFIEGVTALLLDKGRKPIWKPAVLSDVIKDGGVFELAPRPQYDSPLVSPGSSRSLLADCLWGSASVQEGGRP